MILMGDGRSHSVAHDRHLCRDNRVSLMKPHELFQTLDGDGGGGSSSATALVVWQTSAAQRCAVSSTKPSDLRLCRLLF